MAEVARLRTALARMEGCADELRSQLAQTKQQMDTMVGESRSLHLALHGSILCTHIHVMPILLPAAISFK